MSDPQWVRMWEARVEPGRLADVLVTLHRVVVPRLLAAGADAAEVLRSDGDPPRAVLVTGWTSRERADEAAEGDVGGVARAHAWVFERVAGVP